MSSIKRWKTFTRQNGIHSIKRTSNGDGTTQCNGKTRCRARDHLLLFKRAMHCALSSSSVPHTSEPWIHLKTGFANWMTMTTRCANARKLYLLLHGEGWVSFARQKRFECLFLYFAETNLSTCVFISQVQTMCAKQRNGTKALAMRRSESKTSAWYGRPQTCISQTTKYAFIILKFGILEKGEIERSQIEREMGMLWWRRGKWILKRRSAYEIRSRIPLNANNFAELSKTGDTVAVRDRYVVHRSSHNLQSPFQRTHSTQSVSMGVKIKRLPTAYRADTEKKAQKQYKIFNLEFLKRRWNIVRKCSSNSQTRRFRLLIYYMAWSREWFAGLCFAATHGLFSHVKRRSTVGVNGLSGLNVMYEMMKSQCESNVFFMHRKIFKVNNDKLSRTQECYYRFEAGRKISCKKYSSTIQVAGTMSDDMNEWQ